MAKIRHLAFFADSPEDMAKFYVNAFGFEITGRGIASVWLTDGYLDIALLKRAVTPARPPFSCGCTVARMKPSARLSTPSGSEAQVDLTMTDEWPLAQAFVIISAVPVSR